MFDKQILESDTGARLALWSATTAEAPKAVVHICHGLGEHAARYARFAEALSAVGYAVYADDHRGHGETTAPDAPGGFFASEDGWNKVQADQTFVNRFIRDQHPDIPVILFGHSLGGTIAMSYVLNRPETINAVAVWNATTNSSGLHAVLKVVLSVERLFRGKKALSLVNALTFGAWAKGIKPHRTDFDWLSHDEAEVDKYVADPLCGWSVPNGLWGDISDGITDCSDDAKLDALPRNLPFNLVGGEDDPSTEGGKTVLDLDKRLKSKGFENVTTRIKPNTRHETLNEKDRDQTTREFIAWADDVVSGLSAHG